MKSAKILELAQSSFPNYRKLIFSNPLDSEYRKREIEEQTTQEIPDTTMSVGNTVIYIYLMN